MNKLSFRARTLDATKPLPIYHADELPDLDEYSTIIRGVPQMPTGMEKEEESVRGLGHLCGRHFLNGVGLFLFIFVAIFYVLFLHGLKTILLSTSSLKNKCTSHPLS